MSPVERALRADAQRNLERILEAARSVFTDLGLDAGMDLVARRAGVGHGTVFRRFTGKDDLIAAVLADSLQRQADLVERVSDAAPDAAAAFDAFAEAMVEWQLRDRALLEAVSCGALLHERTEEAHLRLAGLAERVVAAARDAGAVRPDITAPDCAFVCHAVARIGVELGPRDPEAWRRYLRVMLDGLRPTGRSLPGRPPGWDDVRGGKGREDCGATSG